MNNLFYRVVFIVIVAFTFSCNTSKNSASSNTSKSMGPHIVFVTGDEEYRSEESMPMLGLILKRELDAKISLCYALDKKGEISPNTVDNISNLDALKTADLVVFFTRFRALPDDQINKILNYVDSGKPVVGFRTSTHTFLYKDNPSKEKYNNEWPAKLFGQQWITHHGHFDDGKNPLTNVTVLNKDHKIMQGVKPFQAYSWLYHVDGGDWKLNGDCDKLMLGTANKTSHGNELEKFPLKNPVAWTKTYTGNLGKTARVFFTTLGHPYDFKDESMRRLSIHGIMWALSMENKISDKGVNVSFVELYNPNNSGFGEVYKKGQKPRVIE